jgi:tRNA(fMet)-specific endonuclease VapC
LKFDREANVHEGAMRAVLHIRGTPIKAYEVQIEGIALAYNLTVMTRNIRKFLKVSQLDVDSWFE